jgi:diamine N-acetyltransferase
MEPSPEPSDEAIINITGEKVVLGPFRRELIPLYQKWFNDFEVNRTRSAALGPKTREFAEDLYGRFSKAEENLIPFTVYERAALRPIGLTSLFNVIHCHRTAEFAILIGKKDDWGRGFGTEATALTLDYGFTARSLHNIMLTVVSYNERGVRAYTRAGFREFGRRREAWRLGGRAYDVVYMDCLVTEFQSPVLRSLLEPSS